MGKKCSFDICKKNIVIFGHCKYCSKHFCTEHRTVERHQCVNINSCRDEVFQSFQIKLLSEKCINTKINKI